MSAPQEPELTLAEELLLLSLDETGADETDWGDAIDAGLAGAILLDLTSAGCIHEDDGRLVLRNCSAPESPLAAEALEAMRGSSKPSEAAEWIARLPKELGPLRKRVAEGLVGRGILEEERNRRLRVFQVTRYPERNPEPERRLRTSLAAVLLGEHDPQAREAMLVALLGVYGLVSPLVPQKRTGEAQRRAQEIGARGAIIAAVEESIRDLEVQVVTSAY